MKRQHRLAVARGPFRKHRKDVPILQGLRHLVDHAHRVAPRLALDVQGASAGSQSSDQRPTLRRRPWTRNGTGKPRAAPRCRARKCGSTPAALAQPRWSPETFSSTPSRLSSVRAQALNPSVALRLREPRKQQDDLRHATEDVRPDTQRRPTPRPTAQRPRRRPSATSNMRGCLARIAPATRWSRSLRCDNSPSRDSTAASRRPADFRNCSKLTRHRLSNTGDRDSWAHVMAPRNRLSARASQPARDRPRSPPARGAVPVRAIGCLRASAAWHVRMSPPRR